MQHTYVAFTKGNKEISSVAFINLRKTKSTAPMLQAAYHFINEIEEIIHFHFGCGLRLRQDL